MEIKNRQKTLLIIVVSIVGLMLAWSVILTPLKAAWDDRNKQIADLKKAVEGDKRLIRDRVKIVGRWEHMKNNVLPGNPTKAGSDILKAKDKWEQESGIKVDSFSPQVRTEEDPDSKEVITTMACRVDATGNMRNLLRFLWAIESDPMGLRLEDVEISSKDNNGQQLTLGLTLSGLILDLPQPETQTAAPHPNP